jgi:DNA-binding NarL/FixJ family response regulator
MIRVIVVDDEQLFRDGIARLVDAAEDMTVVAEAGDGREGVEIAMAHHPDVVLMDMQMPVMDGLSATKEILRMMPGTAVVILTSFQYDEYILPALRDGAAGYLLKDSTIDELRNGIRAAAAGEAILSPAVTRRLLDAVGPSLSVREADAVRRTATLSDREKQVFACVAEGLSNAQIARRLFMAEPTVKTHLTHAMAKTGVNNRTQAAILAYEAGLTMDDAEVG